LKGDRMTKEEVEKFNEYVQKDPYIKPGDINTLNKIDNPNGRIKFKDIKKIDIGFCKNDLMKQKKVFINHLKKKNFKFLNFRKN
jgi:hypothetical protein